MFNVFLGFMFFVMLGLIAFALIMKHIHKKPLPSPFTAVNGLLGAIAIIIVSLCTNSIMVIEGSNYGVLKRFGKIQSEVLTPGVFVKIPMIDKIDVWPGVMVKTGAVSNSASLDLQQATVTWALTWHYEPTAIPRIAEKVGVNAGEILILPTINETLKSVTAKYKAEELISKREIVRTAVLETLTRRFTPYGIRINEFNIIDFEFSKRFSDAVEAKTEAEQLVLKASQDLIRIRIESDQKVAKAEAEAKSLQLQRSAITDSLLELRKIENEGKAIDKWNGVLPIYSGDATPFVDISKLK